MDCTDRIAAKKKLQTEETPRLIKQTSVLISDLFKHPQTKLLSYHFEPVLFQSPKLRLEDCTIQHTFLSTKKKAIYLFDQFFLPEEINDLRQFSLQSSFSKKVMESYEEESNASLQYASAMDNRERWAFFSNPPQAVLEVFKFLSLLSHELNAEVSTLPWELCYKTSSFTAVSTNFVRDISPKHREAGKHWDYNPEEGLAFGIPILYAEDKCYYTEPFINGDVGKPWLVSLILYSTQENFRPEYGMGTVFYTDETKIGFHSECKDARLILFEGDIVHSLEESTIPAGLSTSRVSYVFKLSINPKKENQSVKEMFFNWISNSNKKTEKK
jgi:hypothetical protein